MDGIEASMAFPLVKDRLNWNTNATDDHLGAKDTGNPLSIIPKYTINNSLDWTITRAFSASVNWTLYGRQNRVLIRKLVVKILAVCQVKSWALIRWWGRTSITILIKICVLTLVSAIS